MKAEIEEELHFCRIPEHAILDWYRSPLSSDPEADFQDEQPMDLLVGFSFESPDYRSVLLDCFYDDQIGLKHLFSVEFLSIHRLKNQVLPSKSLHLSGVTQIVKLPYNPVVAQASFAADSQRTVSSLLQL